MEIAICMMFLTSLFHFAFKSLLKIQSYRADDETRSKN